MLAGERKLFAMRIFSGVVAALADRRGGSRLGRRRRQVRLAAGGVRAGPRRLQVRLLRDRHSGARGGGDSGPELNRFFAEFYLARIYSDNSSALTDHAKAYELFQKLADENADADPDDGQRAPFVAKALTALAGYLQARRQGNRRRARTRSAPSSYLQHAATFFGDKDAQFELAKVYLGGAAAART